MQVVNKLKDIVKSNASAGYDDRLNEKIKDLLQKFIKSDFVSLFVYDSKNQTLEHKLFYEKERNTLRYFDNDKVLSMITPQGCIGKVFLTKKSAIYNHIRSDKYYVKEYDNIYGHQLKSQIITPILENDHLLGIITFSTTIKGELAKYTQKELALIEAAIPCYVHIIKLLTASTSSQSLITSFSESEENIAQVSKEHSSVSDDNLLLYFSNTVHDIRTPANSLFGFLELLEDNLMDERLKKFVTNAKESASLINTLTDSILETAKNRYISTRTESTTICPVDFLAEIANTFSAQMLEKKIHYFIKIDPTMPREVKVDALKLKRICINLIGNAYKFTPQKKEIECTVKWSEKEHRIKISIKDTGIGIDEKNQQKLFKSFSQAEDDTHKKYGGSGLGLALSAEYVAQLGGKLEFKSRLNEGSEFYFSIPVEVVDSTVKYSPFYNFEKKIVILTEFVDAKYPKFIRQYLIDFGMPEEKICISNVLEQDTTHLICFEEKITQEIVEAEKQNKFKLLLVENELFSLLTKKELKHLPITSKNVYNGEAIYTTVYSGVKRKILIVDDSKINLSLLEAMLETAYADIYTCDDSERALEMLKNKALKGNAFDIICLDKHMPKLSGGELLKQYKAFEKEHGFSPITAVSISGDPDISDEEKTLFDYFVSKPFNKKQIREVLKVHR